MEAAASHTYPGGAPMLQGGVGTHLRQIMFSTNETVIGAFNPTSGMWTEVTRIKH
jgi:hypothetical protein